MSDDAPLIDWERIEAQYRAGVQSVREIAAEHGISHTAINKRAKAGEWPRDLKAKVQARADALVSKALVSAEVSSESKLETERQTVEVEAQVQARIRLEHRSSIARCRSLVIGLLAEIEDQTESGAEYRKLAEMMEQPDDSGRDKLAEQYHKVIGLTGRVKNLKDLTDALKNLIALERQAFALDDLPPPGAGDLSGFTVRFVKAAP